MERVQRVIETAFVQNESMEQCIGMWMFNSEVLRFHAGIVSLKYHLIEVTSIADKTGKPPTRISIKKLMSD